MGSPGLGHSAQSTHLLSLPRFSNMAGGIPCRICRHVPGVGEGEPCVKSDREDKERTARPDLNLLLADMHVGEGAPESPTLRTHQQQGSLCPNRAPSQGATAPPSLSPRAPVQPRLGEPSPGQPPRPAHLPTCLLRPASMVAGPACSQGGPPPGLMALTEGGRPLSCQSGGAPQSPSWLERGGWACAGARLSGPSQRRGRRGAA